MYSGRIELIVGPMFAGKSTEMLRRIFREELARRRCIVIKFADDTRYSVEKVSTHDLQMHDALPCSRLLPAVDVCRSYEVIGIDEGQFFPDIVEFSEELANYGKRVIIAALDGTYQRRPFGRVLQLISKCETITKLTAICTETGADAPFSQRLIRSDDVQLIGGAEMYRAASRSAFLGIQTCGEIHLTIGPVQSGKTTELIRVLTRHSFARRAPVLITHTAGAPLARDLKFATRAAAELPPPESLAEFQVVGVDEGHRFAGLAQWADALANSGKLVVISALDGDRNQEPYPEIVELFPLCEKVLKFDSICPFTGMPAPFTVVRNLKACPVSRLALIQNLQTANLQIRLQDMHFNF